MSATADVAAGAPQPSEETGRNGRPSVGRRVIGFLEVWGVLITFLAIFLAFSFLNPENFATWPNVIAILNQTGIIILIAVGLTFVLAAGEFDLSFPYLFALVSGVTVSAMTTTGWAVGVALAVGLLVGVSAGFINGALVATKRASSFIVTLALGSLYTGLMIWIAGPSPISENVPAGFSDLAFNFGEVSGVAVIAAVVSVIAAIALRSSLFGRYVQATGNNPDAAAIAGINVSRIRIGAFMVLGLLVAVAAIEQAAISGAHYPETGRSLFLPPFVAAFLGTSVLARGRFTVFGTVVGALFISTLQTGLLVESTAPWVINVLEGLVLLAAVMMATQVRGRRE